MRNFIRVCIALILLAGCLLLVHCGKSKSTRSDGQVNNTDFVAREPFSFEMDAQNRSCLRLEGISGSVTITGSAGVDSVVITGEKRVGSESMQDAQDHLPELETRFTYVGSELYVKTVQPDETYGRSYEVDYDISLPKDLKVIVINVNGAVIIDSISSSLYIVNINGQVTLSHIFCSTLVNLVNGQIQAEITLPTDGAISMSTANGGIGLNIPQSTSANFSATVKNGTISISGLVLTDSLSTPQYLGGRLGDGQGAIILSTTNGSINVTGFRKDEAVDLGSSIKRPAPPEV